MDIGTVIDIVLLAFLLITALAVVMDASPFDRCGLRCSSSPSDLKTDCASISKIS